MKVLVVQSSFTLAAASEEATETAFERGHMIREPDAIKAVEGAGMAHHCTVTDVDKSFFAEDPAPTPKAPKAAA